MKVSDLHMTCRPFYLYNGNSYTGKMTPFYWISPQYDIPNNGLVTCPIGLIKIFKFVKYEGHYSDVRISSTESQTSKPHDCWLNRLFRRIPKKTTKLRVTHHAVIKWKQFPRYWPFVRGIYRSPVNSPHKGQWRGASMFSLICAWINNWVNNREAGDLRRHRAHHDVIVMTGLYEGNSTVTGEIPRTKGH